MNPALRCVLAVVAGSAAAMTIASVLRAQPPAGSTKGGPLKLPYEGSGPGDIVFTVTSTDAKGTALFGKGHIGVAGFGTSVNGTGVGGRAFGVDGHGIYGIGESGADGVYAKSDSGVGVNAKSVGGTAITAMSTSSAGITATSKSSDAIVGTSESGNGVNGESKAKIGVRGVSEAADGKGVAGKGWVGVYGEGKIAGFFNGQTTVHGVLLVNKIDAEEIYGGKKLFRIDHPIEPADKYLTHNSVESDEMMDLYSGNITMGPEGDAWVQLPSWFEALNKDFRYQLTCVGGFAPVYVAQEIQEGRLHIAGGTPGLKVSWQITGIRHDAYAMAHPVHVEETKASGDRGRYVHPVELGFSATNAIGYLQIDRLESDRSRPKAVRADRRSPGERIAHGSK